MYGWIWDHLPGPVPVRAVVAILLVALIIVLLFGWVFPWAAQHLPVDNVGRQTLGSGVEVQ